jgi:hypothetical protein
VSWKELSRRAALYAPLASLEERRDAITPARDILFLGH